MKKITTILILLILVLVVGAFITRVSDNILKSVVADEIEDAVLSEYNLNEIALLSLVSPYVEEILENEIVIKDNILFKKIEMHNLIDAEYVSIMGRLIIITEPTFNLKVLEDIFTSENVEEPMIEHKYQFDEMYTNILIDINSSDYKILKFQMTIIYTDRQLESKLEDDQDMIIDYVSGYFRDVTVEMVNEENGKTKIKNELLEGISGIVDTDSINNILLTQFVIQ